jgi:hypothetical protein
MRKRLFFVILILIFASCNKETTSIEPQRESDVLITCDSLEVRFWNFNFSKYDVSGKEAIKLVGTANADTLFIDIYDISFITDSMKISLDDTRSMKIETRLSEVYFYVSNRGQNQLGIAGYLLISAYEESSLIEAEFSTNSRITLGNFRNPSDPIIGPIDILGTIKARRVN